MKGGSLSPIFKGVGTVLPGHPITSFVSASLLHTDRVGGDVPPPSSPVPSGSESDWAQEVSTVRPSGGRRDSEGFLSLFQVLSTTPGQRKTDPEPGPRCGPRERRSPVRRPGRPRPLRPYDPCGICRGRCRSGCRRKRETHIRYDSGRGPSVSTGFPYLPVRTPTPTPPSGWV